MTTEGTPKMPAVGVPVALTSPLLKAVYYVRNVVIKVLAWNKEKSYLLS
jgi:hypothetical protein